MQLVLTDALTCPRCGPDFGLVVLADRLQERRVLEGVLGCANCRESYPIRGGVPDLRFPPAEWPSDPPPPQAAPPSEEDAFRLAALLGLTPVPGLVVVTGEAATLGGELVRLVPEIGVAVVGPDVLGLPERAGVSRLLIGDRLPLRTGSARAVALAGEAAEELLEEGLRALAAGGRIVLDPAPADATARLEAQGVGVLLQQESIVVASRPAHR